MRSDQQTGHHDNEKPDLVVLGAQCHFTRPDSKLGLGRNSNESGKQREGMCISVECGGYGPFAVACSTIEASISCVDNPGLI